MKHVHAESPDRCQAVTQSGQCDYQKCEHSNYCELHGGHNGKVKVMEENKRLYRVAKWQDRIGTHADHDKVKSLREEIGILRMVLEETLSQCKDGTELLLYANRITETVIKIEKVVASCHRLETATGGMLDKSQALQLAAVMVEIVGKYVTDQDALDAIATEFGSAVMTSQKVESGKT